jgi:hypothetical protein
MGSKIDSLFSAFQDVGSLLENNGHQEATGGNEQNMLGQGNLAAYKSWQLWE